VVPRLSLASANDLLAAATFLNREYFADGERLVYRKSSSPDTCVKDDWRNSVGPNSNANIPEQDNISQSPLSITEMLELLDEVRSEQMQNNPKLFPLGDVLWLEPNSEKEFLWTSPSEFQEIEVDDDMFGRHTPGNYLDATRKFR